MKIATKYIVKMKYNKQLKEIAAETITTKRDLKILLELKKG